MDIVLIGMPGCGKSAIGRNVARRLNMPFIDMDSEIERLENRKISEIFAADGEDGFRRCETECLKKILGQNRVIATGGGVVVREENADIIRAGGALVVFIDRPTENIVGDVRTDTRPLLKDGAERVYKLYEERYDKYKALCNIRVVNDKTVNYAVNKIAEEVQSYENNGN